MPFNLLKIFDALLEIDHLDERDRTLSIRRVFDRDFDGSLQFIKKQIRPISIDGKSAVDVLFDHLTTRDEVDEKGKKTGRRCFERYRSIRLHWIKFHLELSKPDIIDIFSVEDRIDKKDVIRTYIYDRSNSYVIILEPQKSGRDYYFLTAYFLSEKAGINQIESKSKKRLPDIH